MQSVLKVVCCPLQASLGGRVRLMATGAAPISPTVLTFLRAAIGCQVTQTSSSCVQVSCVCSTDDDNHQAFSLSQFFEGYGQTECTAGCTLTMPGDWTAGNKAA